MTQTLRLILQMIVLLLLQAAVLNNATFTSIGLLPHLYVIGIILMPFTLSGWVLLIIAFVSGLTLDLFTDNYGVNTSALTFLAFMRPTVLKFLAPYDGYETGTRPDVSHYGFSWFIPYALTLVFGFQIIYNILDVFSFQHFGITVLRILGSSVYTLVLILLHQALLSRIIKM